MSSTVAVLSVEVEKVVSPYRRILVPTDGSALSQQAVQEALKLASATDAAVVFLTVSEPFHLVSSSVDMIEATRDVYESEAEAHADAVLKQAATWASRAGVPYVTVRIRAEHPHDAIIKIARERNCELIAMATHGRRGLSAMVLGSVTQKVLAFSTIPVLVLRKSAETVGEAS